jgi:hypothetical protein
VGVLSLGAQKLSSKKHQAKRGPKGKPQYKPEFILATLKSYTEQTQIPILVEVCYLNQWIREYLYQIAETNEEISDAIKQLIQKKEANLERDGLAGKIDKTMAVFSLKQLGWKDRQEITGADGKELEIGKVVFKIVQPKTDTNA